MFTGEHTKFVILSKKSKVYFHQERNSPYLDWETSISKK